MSFQGILDDMIKIEESIFDFLDNEEPIEKSFGNLQAIFGNHQINQNDLLSIFYLITKIANNYHRGPLFFEKIEKILEFFTIKKYFTNYEIFKIFKSNKRILLSLIEMKILTFDNQIVEQITSEKFFDAFYPQYFSPEIKPFLNEKWFQKVNNHNKISRELKKELPQYFYENRKIGENEGLICYFIRNDLVEDFISLVNKKNYLLRQKVESSIYETNSFLIKNQKSPKNENMISLIDYALFFGSIQIINYLLSNNFEFTSKSWLFAIHSKNPDIIHLIEDNHVELIDSSYKQVFKESVKCHHNSFAYYFKNNFFENIDDCGSFIIKQALKYYNFQLIDSKLIDSSSFGYLCKYDYRSIVQILIENPDIEINTKII